LLHEGSAFSCGLFAGSACEGRREGLSRRTKSPRQFWYTFIARAVLLISRTPHRGAHRAQVRGVAQPGRAPGSGPGGRRFKSSLPDQFFSHLLSSLHAFATPIPGHFRRIRYSVQSSVSGKTTRLQGRKQEINSRSPVSSRLESRCRCKYFVRSCLRGRPGAGRSLPRTARWPEFPANRKIYREFSSFCSQNRVGAHPPGAIIDRENLSDPKACNVHGACPELRQRWISGARLHTRPNCYMQNLGGCSPIGFNRARWVWTGRRPALEACRNGIVRRKYPGSRCRTGPFLWQNTGRCPDRRHS
jgi:hypothetical protein